MICNVSQYRRWRNENLYCIPPGVLDEGVSFVREGFIRLNKFLDSLESKCKPRLKILSAGGSDAKYRIHRDGIYAPYVLTVNDLQYSDSGSYYCCLPSNCSNDVKNNCQRFVLGVRGKKQFIVPSICRRWNGERELNLGSVSDQVIAPGRGGGGIPQDGDGDIVISLFDLTYGGHKGNLVFSLGVKLK